MIPPECSILLFPFPTSHGLSFFGSGNLSLLHEVNHFTVLESNPPNLSMEVSFDCPNMELDLQGNSWCFSYFFCSPSFSPLIFFFLLGDIRNTNVQTAKAAETEQVEQAEQAIKAEKAEQAIKAEKAAKPPKPSKIVKSGKTKTASKKAAKYVQSKKLGHEACGTNPPRPLPPAAAGSTQSGDRTASSQPATRRKLQKKPPGTSEPPNPWRTMKPIGEYPSPAEYRGAGVTPSAQRVPERVATPSTLDTEFERAASDSGVENFTADKGNIEYLTKGATVASQSPEVESPADETTPTIGSVAETKTPDYQAILKALPLPTFENYDVLRLRTVLKFSIMHATTAGTADSAMSLLYLWSNASSDEFTLSLINNLAKGEDADEQLKLALMSVLKNSESDANQWYQNYIGAAAVELPSGSDSGVSSAKSPGPEPGFKVSDIYRDTSGPRMEEQFMSGKSNTAPLKRPKKPCPVNENAYKRKRQWESDPNQEERIREKRARYAAAQPSLDEILAYSACRDERGPPDAIEHPYTFDDTAVIERSRSLPVTGSILDIQIIKGPGPPAPSVHSPATSHLGYKEGKPHSKTQIAKAKRPATTQRARSLSVDTTISSLSSLSNSAYSVRFNEWSAEHEPRQMPNSMYVLGVTESFLFVLFVIFANLVTPQSTPREQR